ncbi:hypothetical protein B566_EDAN006247 [Ephemera danica]|nr:hypothetical protein B566_EDAN006247 [Ephemera danica]
MPSQDTPFGRYVIPPENLINHHDTNPDLELNTDSPPFLHRKDTEQNWIIDEICKTVIKDMDSYGVCVLDNFLGPDKGQAVFHEVLGMYDKGVFKAGQLVSSKIANDVKKIRGDQIRTIRGDQITWIDGKENYCRSIGLLISRVDAVIMRANQMSGNGKLGSYTINGRTKVHTFVFFGAIH